MKVLVRSLLLGLIGVALACPNGAAAETAQRFEFLDPHPATYAVEAADTGPAPTTSGAPTWLRARLEPGGTSSVWLGQRVVLGASSPSALASLLSQTMLPVDRVVTSNLVVLAAPDAWIAAAEASRLSQLAGVWVCHPVRRRPARLHDQYAPRPNDTLFGSQWHLENRNAATAAPQGFDLNARSAWGDKPGNGILIAIADNGVELAHPDLAANATNQVHHNFITGTSNGNHATSGQAHGTAVAGLIAAVGNNRKGVLGVAPQAQIASWVIFDRYDTLADEETVMDMFQYRSNVVSVQNHSWGNADVSQLPLSALESQGIANAVERGRQGRGVVIARSAGNGRLDLNDVNDDGFGQDPRAIAVGAVRSNGRAASYSTPGAPVLVAAFSGDESVENPDGSTTNYVGVATTDRQGSLGYNTSGSSADYGFQSTAFTGTSASSPQIAGLCALILAANPGLTYRDVQQVLILSARQLDPADPDLSLNGAGLPVSHNVGFGVPDAGLAAELARAWPTRPPRTSASASFRQTTEIPDDGLRVMIRGGDVPSNLQSIPAWPSDGLHPDSPTQTSSLVDVGQALSPPTVNLNKRAALIKRGVNSFAEKIANVAAAGARFAIVYNDQGTAERLYMNGADIQFQPIPAVFIDRTRGEALRSFVAATPGATAQLELNAARCSLTITQPLLCEHVQLHARFSHPRRADIRITLVSPAGTRSVLQRFNDDTTSALSEWSFYSTHHFYESSAGTWQVEISDERSGATGRVLSLELTVFGVAIQDTDRDGLDDAWETEHLGTLAQGPRDDLDQDGWNNLRESLLDRDPAVADRPFTLDLSRWDSSWGRLSWPASPDYAYEVWLRSAVEASAQMISRQAGRFPSLEFIVPITTAGRFYQVQQVPAANP